MRLIYEAVLAGIFVVVIGSIVGYILGRFFSTKLPIVCRTWNKNHIMEISLFFTGFFGQIIGEYLGLNKWYCQHGNACKK